MCLSQIGAEKKESDPPLSVAENDCDYFAVCVDGGALQRAALHRGLAEIESSQVLKTSAKTP